MLHIIIIFAPRNNIRYGKEKYDPKDQRRYLQREGGQLSGMLQHDLSSTGALSS